ncbi:MAG: sirohydrochlorin cobaltochelatase, partial [Eubacterium sp.]|nr:sirohydrochlorin cobaltochelatase [Eubacterium sp.]
MTVDEEAGTLLFDPTTLAVDVIDGMTEEEAIAKASELTSPLHVDELIAAIQVQVRDENTDKYCAVAKAFWDALSDEEKEEVDDPDYFGLDTGDASKDNPLNQDEIGENELLVVSFGTSFNGSRVATIGAIEKALAEAYPEYSVRRAFTAQIIINHVQARDGEKIDNMQQALDRAVANGVKNLVVQPTHLMHGAEYDELVEALAPYQDKMTITVSEPLLSTQEDKDTVAEALIAETVAKSDYDTIDAMKADGAAIVYMGHGTAHEANVTYTQMQETINKLGYTNVFVGTVEGNPPATALPVIFKAVKDAGFKKVILRPMMVVAGDHANNDMAGD